MRQQKVVEHEKNDGVIVARKRVYIIIMSYVLCCCVVMMQLIDLSTKDSQVVRHHMKENAAKVAKVRRAIADRNGTLLALNLKTYSIYADPKKIDNVEQTLKGLQYIFPDLDVDEMRKRLSNKARRFEWIREDVHPDEVKKFTEYGMPGVYLREGEKRAYPHGNLFSHLLGIVGNDGDGLAGIEKRYDEELSVDVYTNELQGALRLSLDVRVQNVLRHELLTQIEEYEALGAAGAVMDVRTGELLAVVSLPDFDSNDASELKGEAGFNRATLGTYELGSVFKPFMVAAALDSGKVKLSDTYDVTKRIRIGRHTISDHHMADHVMAVPEILIESSNIGTAKIADYVGSEIEKDYYKRLGLLDALEIGLPEVGTPSYPKRWGRLDTMTTSYGHGIAVTPLHVLAATAAVVNGGVYYQPTLLLRKEDDMMQIGKRVFKEETSNVMRKLLRLVVEEGTGKNAAAEGYRVGGKTGTAEKSMTDKKGYNRKKMITSFSAAFPMDAPRYAVFVMMDEAKGNKKTFGWATAGWMAAPVVKRVVEQIGPILGVKPKLEIKEVKPSGKTASYTTEGVIYASF